MQRPITICRYLDVRNTPGVEAGIDAIFFEASNTKTFADAAERAAFRERWLGRYLRNDSQYAYLACVSHDVVGYLVGALESAELRSSFEQSGLAGFCEMATRFPAHLHVNVSADDRGAGIGGRLIDAFVVDARRAGSIGIHVITSAASPNVRFYNRNGFLEAARSGPEQGLVMLARPLV